MSTLTSNRQRLLIILAGAAVLFALAAPTARRLGWGAAFAYIGIYVVIMAIFLKIFGWSQRTD